MYREDVLKEVLEKLRDRKSKGCITGDEERLLNVLLSDNIMYINRFLELNSDFLYIIDNLMS